MTPGAATPGGTANGMGALAAAAHAPPHPAPILADTQQMLVRRCRCVCRVRASGHSVSTCVRLCVPHGRSPSLSQGEIHSWPEQSPGPDFLLHQKN